MQISSKNINASDLGGVYDYFDSVVNQLIRSEIDTETFPNLQAFVEDLVEFVNRLDELIQDVNPRVEKYLRNKEEEARVRHEIEDLQNHLAELKQERKDLVGAQVEQDSGSDVFSYDDFPTVIGDAAPHSTGTVFASPNVDIIFDTDIEDMMSDTSDLESKALFDEDAERELAEREEQETRKKQEEEESLQREIEAALYKELSPLDALGGKLEMYERGDTYDDLTPEDDLYLSDEEEDDDAGEDDYEFSFAYLPDNGDYHYEDDDLDDDLPSSLPGGSYDDGSEQDEDDDDDLYDPEYDDEDYEDEDTGTDGGQGDAGDIWDDDLSGPNIDQLLSSASMTI